MKNKRVTVLAADINSSVSGQVYSIDPTMDTYLYDGLHNITETIPALPLDLCCQNDTGATLGFNFISNSGELWEYEEYPNMYDFVLLRDGDILSNDVYNLPRCARFLVRLEAGTATDDLIIEFINYTPYK